MHSITAPVEPNLVHLLANFVSSLMPALLVLDQSFFTLLAIAPQTLFNQTGSMEAEGFQVFEEGDIPIYLMEDLPGFQVHNKLEMASSPSMSQQEYERNILGLG